MNSKAVGLTARARGSSAAFMAAWITGHSPVSASSVPSAFAASSKVRPLVYKQAVPQVASNLIGVSALAFPEQLIEIAFRAEVQG